MGCFVPGLLCTEAFNVRPAAFSRQRAFFKWLLVGDFIGNVQKMPKGAVFSWIALRGVVKEHFDRGPVKHFAALILIKLDLIQFDLTWFTSEYNYACLDFCSLRAWRRETPKLFCKSALFTKVCLISLESSLKHRKLESFSSRTPNRRLNWKHSKKVSLVSRGWQATPSLS